MRITIDDKLCTKYKLTLPQALVLVSSYLEDLAPTLGEIESKLAFTGNSKALTEQWKGIMEGFLSEATNTIEDEEWLSDIAKRLAQTFPQGKMPGTAFYYRCNNKELSNKIKKFFIAHPEYKPTDEMAERIIKAADRYNKDMDRDPQYRVLAKYFISKLKPVTGEDGITHNEETSILATYLENEGQEDSNNDDWLVQSFN